MSEIRLEVTTQQFAEWTVQQVRRGFGLVPFVGSGLSAPSGILTGQDFSNFLAWTVYRCVAEPTEPNKGEVKKRRHDLRRDGWPDVPNQTEINAARKWIWDSFVKVCDNCGGTVNKPEPITTEALAADSEMRVLSLSPTDRANPLNWNISRPLVPEIIRDGRMWNAEAAARKLFHDLGREAARQRLTPRRGQFASSTAYVEEAAVRALHEWRAALVFLARLRVDNTGRDVPLALDDQPDQAVVDAFNFRITRARRPNLAHNMLCHLAGRARIQTLLTTNFDTLIEDAFAQLGQPLTSIPVSVRGELPAAETILSQASVVKMHGSLLETRADFSLDDPPAPADLDRFFTYVRGRAPGEPPRIGHLPGLLLVCGYSGGDLRCVEMIQHLLEADRNAKVLWVCHTKNDVKNLKDVFPAYEPKTSAALTVPLPWADARVIVTVTNRCDLLLYDIYQRLTLSLPRGGFNYQFSPNVPPDLEKAWPESDSPFPDDPADAGAKKKFLAPATLWPEWSEGQRKYALDLWAQIQPALVPADPATPLTSVIHAVDGASGLLQPVRAVFRHVAENKRSKGSLWLYLGDHANTTSLAHELFTVMALRLGYFQLDYARFDPVLDPPEKEGSIAWGRGRWLPVVNDLLRHWDTNPDDWFVVVDGRSGPGGSAGWTRKAWEQDDYRELIGFLRALTAARNPRASEHKGIHVLYQPFSKDRFKRLKKHGETLDIESGKFRQTITDDYRSKGLTPPAEVLNNLLHRFPPPEKWTVSFGAKMTPPVEVECKAELILVPLSGVSPATTYEDRLERVRKYWVDHGQESFAGRRSLYAASLLRHSRHFSLFVSEGILPCPRRYNAEQFDNDWSRNGTIQDWLSIWTKDGILQAKTGGFYWMYRDLRLGIERTVEEGVQPVEINAPGGEARWMGAPWEGRARIHFWIADWYARAYRATGHAEPLLEALYHYAQAVRFAPCARIGVPVKGHPKGEEPDLPRYRGRYARRALFEILKTLRLGRREIRFWMQAGAGEAWFGKEAMKKLTKEFKQVFTNKEVCMGAPFNSTWEAQLQAEVAQLPRADDGQPVLAPPRVLTTGATLKFKHFLLPNIESLHDPEGWWEHVYKQISPLGKEALTGLVKIFKELKSDPRTDYGSRLNRALKRHAAAASGKDMAPEARHLFIQAVIELAYATAKCAKRAENCWGTSGLLQRKEPIQQLWIDICALCWLALDSCFDLPPALLAADCRLRIAAGTLYGLAMGRLGRFFEAHRRFNEAHGWLSKSTVRLDPLEMAIIEIRRAEVHLLEAIRLRAIIEKLEPDFLNWDRLHTEDPKATAARRRLLTVPKKTAEQWQEIYLGKKPENVDLTKPEAVREELLRIHIAKLDDAWLALEPAERALSGKTHSSLWWGRLHTLRLRIYAEHWPIDKTEESFSRPYRARVFSGRWDHVAAVQRIYRAGRAAIRLNAYQELQLMDYVLKALKVAAVFGFHRDPDDDVEVDLTADQFLAEELGPRLKGGFPGFDLEWHIAAKGSAAEILLKSYHKAVSNMLRDLKEKPRFTRKRGWLASP